MTVGSLFAGIGGIELGLERTGHFKTTWQVEIDPYATRVLEKHWPDAQRYSDIRSITELPHVDIVCGGFPCQDISNAGKRAGLAGNRSGLWSEFARIIHMVRPTYVLVENVSALRGRGLGRVLGNLAACGYDAEWDCIPASAVGAPHQRDRIFIVAYPNRKRLPEWSECDCESKARLQAPRRNDSGRRSSIVANPLCEHVEEAFAKKVSACGSETLANSDLAGSETQRKIQEGEFNTLGCSKAQQQEHDPDSSEFRHWQQKACIFPGRDGIERFGWWSAEPDVGRVAHGISYRVDRLRCLGNAVVPQVAEYLGRLIVEFDNARAK